MLRKQWNQLYPERAQSTKLPNYPSNRKTLGYCGKQDVQEE
jgi:hypothetical protein